MPAKVPHSLKLARGTVRKDRPAENPQPQSGRPIKPEWLDGLGAAKWEEITALLEAEGQLSPIYGDFIAEYCRAFADAAAAQAVIDEEGMVASGDKGGVYQHPAVGIKNQAIDRMMKFGRQLGISAASIKQVQKNKKQETDSGKKRFFG